MKINLDTFAIDMIIFENRIPKFAKEQTGWDFKPVLPFQGAIW